MEQDDQDTKARHPEGEHEELLSMHARMDALLSSIPALVYFKDRELRYVAANRAFCDVVGVGEDQIEGKIDYDLFPRSEAETFRRDDARVIRTGQPIMHREEPVTSVDGRQMWALTSKTPYRNIRGHVEGVVGITLDISARKRAEAELSHHRANLEALVSERTRQLEETQKELLARAVEAGRIQSLDIMLHNIGNAVTPILLETDKLNLLNRDQPLQYLLACYQELVGHKGDLNHYIEIDPRGREIFSYMGRLLNSMQGQCQKGISEAAEAIRNSVEHISEILKSQSRSLACGESRERIRMAELVEKALLIQTPSIKKRQIGVERQLDPEVAFTGDRNAMMQVLMNILKNAYEAIDALADQFSKKEILIRCFQEEGLACLEITDSGVGLSPSEQRTAFDARISKKGSSGFGLFYSKAVVESYGGRISIQSRGKEKGATVRIMFEAV